MDTDLSDCTVSRHPHAFINKVSEPILIRPLDEKRQQQLIQMYLAYEPKASFAGLPPAEDAGCTKWVQGMISDGANLAAMAFDRGIVGHAGLFPINPDVCEMLIVVSPPYQNIGIGTELVRCTIQASHEMGFKRLWATLECTNLRCRHVLKKCGFERLTAGDKDEIEMRLDLTEYHDPTNVSVGEIMNRHVSTVFRDWPCRSALAMFLDNPVGALPVINDQCEVVGILSQTDLLVPANIDRKVGDVLTRRVITVDEECPLTRVIRLFRSKKVRCIPVVDRDMKLVGIVTRKDILAYYSE